MKRVFKVVAVVLVVVAVLMLASPGYSYRGGHGYYGGRGYYGHGGYGWGHGGYPYWWGAWGYPFFWAPGAIRTTILTTGAIRVIIPIISRILTGIITPTSLVTVAALIITIDWVADAAMVPAGLRFGAD